MIVTREELISRARDLVPMLRKRASAAEQLRSLPPDTQQELIDAGLYRIYLPYRYGGYELDYQLQIDIAAELGRGCGSTAWVWSIVESHHWVQAMMDPRAQDDVWAENPDALIASAFPTRDATITEVDGGFVADGTWGMASGIDVCDWVHLNMMIPGSDHRFGLVPKASVELVDDWHAAGLRGTGSRSLRLSQEFIPAYRTINTHECVGGPTPGSVINRAPLYRMPLFALFAHGIAGPAVGVALGALDSVVDSARSGRSRAGAALAQQQSVLVRLAEATAEIDAARGLLQAASDEAHTAAAAGVTPAVPDRVRWRRNGAYAATMCMRAVQRLHPLAGAGAISEDHAFQRSLRDIHAVCAHIALTWDIQATNYGGVLLGQPSVDPKL